MNKERFFDKKKMCFILCCSIVWSVLAHGMAFFNKYSFRDDSVSMFGVGGTYNLGRWALDILGNVMVKVYGSANFSTPLFLGVSTILMISVFAYLIFSYIKIDNNCLLVIGCGILVAFPTVTGLMGYVYTIPYYFFGTMIGIAGIYCFFRQKKWYVYILCISCMAGGIGIYQANIPVFVSALLLFMLQDVHNGDGKWKIFWIEAIESVLICLGSIVLYFGINAFFVNIFNIEMSSYKGINNWGKTSIVGYLSRVIVLYKEYFSPTDNVSANMYPFSTRILYKILISLIIFLMIAFIVNVMKRNANKGIQELILFILVPFATYFIYIMCDESEVHGLMTYAEAFNLIFVLWLIQNNFGKGNLLSFVGKIAIRLLCVIVVLHCRFANICYLKANFMQSQAISYYTALITRITSVEGYTTGMPVVYINEFRKNEGDIVAIPQFEDVYLHPYIGNTVINDYAWKETMSFWCGYAPKIVNGYQYTKDDRIVTMPNYPEYGSIQKIDDVIVIKFADIE